MDCLDAHFYEIDCINILVTNEFLVKYLINKPAEACSSLLNCHFPEALGHCTNLSVKVH
jgi:hypothetical protein